MRLQRAVWKSLSRLFGVYCMHLLLLTNADTCFLYSDPEAGMLGAGQDHKGTDDEWREECRALALSARAARAGAAFPFAGLCSEDRDTVHGAKKY